MFRKIDIGIWQDPTFRALSQDSQFFFIYLLTSPHSTQWGAYVLNSFYAQGDTKMSQQMVIKCFGELEASKLINRDQETEVICFKNWFHFNPCPNIKSAHACVAGIKKLPKSMMLWDYFQTARKRSSLLGRASLSCRQTAPNSLLTVRSKLGARPQKVMGLEGEGEGEERRGKGEEIRAGAGAGASEVLAYLNLKTGKRFTRKREILARLKEGKTVEQCKIVIDNQSQDDYFIKNPKYLQPTTLFQESKFDKYLNNTPALTDKLSDAGKATYQWLKDWIPPEERGENGQKSIVPALDAGSD